ncbi:DUF6624 domain-containing protein [Flavobacterium sp.]|uniref:DUF6624 domain-containing protein n=1 Tax=Flavobacterium sp. TaxID=239 RepID=UPI0037C1077C
MDYKSIAAKIIELKNADLALREKLVLNGKLSESYNTEMKSLHNKNAKILDTIINAIGYPTIDKVGEEAYDAAWLIIQHSIEQPSFMKKCAELLEIAVRERKADPKSLAYLTDRIAVLEGIPQLYGTQFDWDEDGKLSPNHFDDLSKVNERRKLLGLTTIEEQTELIRKRVQDEKQTPPKDVAKRKQEIETWKRNLGWIK